MFCAPVLLLGFNRPDFMVTRYASVPFDMQSSRGLCQLDVHMP